MRRVRLWPLAAVLGLVLAVVIAWAASQLTGQRIGLSSDPLSITRGLAPAPHAGPRRRPARRDRSGTGRTETPTVARGTPASVASTGTVAPGAGQPPPASGTTVLAAPSTVTTTTGHGSGASARANSGGEDNGARPHRDD
jgi:hypothetical protein